MFRSLSLTAKINCTYKIQITLFNLKMIGPGPLSRGLIGLWCMALVYCSTANPTVFCTRTHATIEPKDI